MIKTPNDEKINITTAVILCELILNKIQNVYYKQQTQRKRKKKHEEEKKDIKRKGAEWAFNARQAVLILVVNSKTLF